MFRRFAPFAGILLFSAAFAATAHADGGRKVISLDGTWQIAEGTMDDVALGVDRQAPVPGLADMAVPAFEGVGVKDKDPRRAAFWYRRTFTIEGQLPAVARLKVHKARYGTRVSLNGQLLGDHVGCFTPGYFDAGKCLKGGGRRNELWIRVGASHTAVGDGVPWGHDFEKTRYIPGICDSVELILSGSPCIDSVQAVPDVPGKTVRVASLLRNPGGTGAEAVVRCKVRKAKTRKIVASADSPKLLLESTRAADRRTGPADRELPAVDARRPVPVRVGGVGAGGSGGHGSPEHPLWHEELFLRSDEQAGLAQR